MKKYLTFITFTFMTVFGLTLVSCGDDEDGIELTIVGTWEITDMDANSSIEGFTISGEIGTKVKFLSDGTYVSNDEKGRWKKEGNKLIITSDDTYSFVPSAFIITKQNNSVMELMLEYGNMLKVVLKLKRFS